ncbi:MAG: Holliday junction resolvase Hjc [Candidatus Woesearchaeota archaeon]
MSRKSKGINAERELLHLFWQKGWACIRVAGSGASRYPTPDIIASNGKRVYAIECKCCKGDYQYFEHEEIEKLKIFSQTFGAEPWVAVRFNNTSWKCLQLGSLKHSRNSYVVYRTTKALTIEELTQPSTPS